MLITTLDYSTLIAEKESQIPVRSGGKDLQLPNRGVTYSTLNLRQMFPYANKELSNKTSKAFFAPQLAYCCGLQHQSGSQACTKPGTCCKTQNIAFF